MGIGVHKGSTLGPYFGVSEWLLFNWIMVGSPSSIHRAAHHVPRLWIGVALSRRMFSSYTIQGRIQDFKLGGGAHFKKIAPSGGRRENIWGFNEMMMRSACTRPTYWVGFYSANSLKQQSAGRHVAPLGHIIPSPPIFALTPIIRSCKSKKNRQYNGQKKRDKDKQCPTTHYTEMLL
jgi:hypothetical protein